MKIRDLMKELEKFDPNAELVIRNDDGSYTEDICLEETTKYVIIENGSKTIECVVIF